MENYASSEFAETATRVFAPVRAGAGGVKAGITKLQNACKISTWHRARELWLGRTRPSVEEMDRLRKLDGRWCDKARRAVKPALEAMHDKIDDIYEFVSEWKRKRKERSLSKKGFIERAYVHQDDRA
jgi:hypothetical protein